MLSHFRYTEYFECFPCEGKKTRTDGRHLSLSITSAASCGSPGAHHTVELRREGVFVKRATARAMRTIRSGEAVSGRGVGVYRVPEESGSFARGHIRHSDIILLIRVVGSHGC
jgi:hypothetical protein